MLPTSRGSGDQVSGEIDLREIDIFSEMTKRELKSIERLMTTVQVESGRVLTTQGEPGREFMVIYDGTARVDIDGEPVADLGPSDFVGELAIITGTPRTATVTATSAMTLEVLNRREFMSLLDESASLSRKVLIGAVKRLQQNERPRTN